MSERIAAAEGLAQKFQVENCPILVDFMDDKANRSYGALPERLYIILNGKIVYMEVLGLWTTKSMKLKNGYKISNLSKKSSPMQRIKYLVYLIKCKYLN